MAEKYPDTFLERFSRIVREAVLLGRDMGYAEGVGKASPNLKDINDFLVANGCVPFGKRGDEFRDRLPMLPEPLGEYEAQELARCFEQLLGREWVENGRNFYLMPPDRSERQLTALKLVGRGFLEKQPTNPAEYGAHVFKGTELARISLREYMRSRPVYNVAIQAQNMRPPSAMPLGRNLEEILNPKEALVPAPPAPPGPQVRRDA